MILEIPYYRNFISEPFLKHLEASGRPVPGVPDLTQVGESGGLESREGLAFMCELYDIVRGRLDSVLRQRGVDRKFIDERTRACRGLSETILGQQDGAGRVVAGPLRPDFAKGGGSAVAPLPEFLKGPHVTLFGPPGDPKLCVNAMNAFHRRLPHEPLIVSELLAMALAPKWGADDEDSKTPLREDLIQAGINLSGCFNGTLTVPSEGDAGKAYKLEQSYLALPIKRFPGLALPAPFLLLRGNPIPLHIYDFALHLYEHWQKPEALSFYVPKLENEEEAAYIHEMVARAEELIQRRHPEYRAGTVRLFVVLENPRAIFRVNEIMDALYPYFAGASLGWHDYLASTARLFKEDPNYRIPVKADPHIVIKYIKASHEILTATVGARGGVKIGGMYGVLPVHGNPSSFQVTIKGYIKDVITQMKRGLDGFWVAHPDFVRLGLALVEAWRRHKARDSKPLETLITSLLDPRYHDEVLRFVHGPDMIGLDPSDPGYPRSLIVADLKQSDIIANNHPEEVRYNVFQALQYLADWLSGNGCVALPAEIDGVAVRVMDDLATTERSRWEVWHEIHHGRFSLEEFLRIVHEELLFIRKDRSSPTKSVQVKWDARTAKWYPVAMNVLIRLMTDPEPVEFASELLLPFTVGFVREASAPWIEAARLDPVKFRMDPYIHRFNEFFYVCGHLNFAREMASRFSPDAADAEALIRAFSVSDIREASGFHGDIGESGRTLDDTAAHEQAGVLRESDKIREDLLQLGHQYKERFGFKFLISAKDKSAGELLAELVVRLENRPAQELENARAQLWEISRKRLVAHKGGLRERLMARMNANGIGAASIHVTGQGRVAQTFNLGAPDGTWFELASLSKPVAAAFALEFFHEKDLALTDSVNSAFKKAGSAFRLSSDDVQLIHLLNHTALGMHYVKGVPTSSQRPTAEPYLKEIEVLGQPGETFRYSGGGYLVLEHLLETFGKKTIQEMTGHFFDRMGLVNLTFEQRTRPETRYALGESRLMFPALAAGAMGTARDVSRFLGFLTQAFHRTSGAGPISHDTAVRMLKGIDQGSMDFMGCRMGLGVFIAEAGPNRFMVHQGANDGFRCLFAHCFDGPDLGKGFTILCTGEFPGVLFTAQAAQDILRELEITGINPKNFQVNWDPSGCPGPQVVNQAFKHMIFNAFTPDWPEAIARHGEPDDPLAAKNLAVGGRIVEVSDQGFACAENLISPYLPTFDPALFGRQGKIMDSWETVRHSPKKRDWVTIELKKPSVIRQVSLSTRFHLGNQAERVTIEGQGANGDWCEILPPTALDGHAIQYLESSDPKTRFHIVRVTMFPDGGLTRLGLFAEPVAEASHKFKDPIPKVKKPLFPLYQASGETIKRNWNAVQPDTEVNVASAALGAKILRASNEHYGPAAQIISPYAPLHMYDGFETARSRKMDHKEFVELELGAAAKLHRFEADFTYFRNNNPREIQVDGYNGVEWLSLIAKTDVKAYAGNVFSIAVNCPEEIIKLKVSVFPDGGINRVRAWSRL